MKEGMSNNSTTSISQARKAVEQLKMEACMDRVKVNLPSMFLPLLEWPDEARCLAEEQSQWGCACSRAVDLPRGAPMRSTQCVCFP